MYLYLNLHFDELKTFELVYEFMIVLIMDLLQMHHEIHHRRYRKNVVTYDLLYNRPYDHFLICVMLQIVQADGVLWPKHLELLQVLDIFPFIRKKKLLI